MQDDPNAAGPPEGSDDPNAPPEGSDAGADGYPADYDYCSHPEAGPDCDPNADHDPNMHHDGAVACPPCPGEEGWTMPPEMELEFLYGGLEAQKRALAETESFYQLN